MFIIFPFELISSVNINMLFNFTSISLIICQILWALTQIFVASASLQYVVIKLLFTVPDSSCILYFLHNFEIILQNLNIKTTIIFCRFCMELKTRMNKISRHDIYMISISNSLFSLKWIKFILSVFVRLSCIQMLSERITLFFSKS